MRAGGLAGRQASLFRMQREVERDCCRTAHRRRARAARPIVYRLDRRRQAGAGRHRGMISLFMDGNSGRAETRACSSSTLATSTWAWGASKATAAPCKLRELQQEIMIVYPGKSRPSFSNRVLAIFSQLDLQPGKVLEVRELQIALGLAAGGRMSGRACRVKRH